MAEINPVYLRVDVQLHLDDGTTTALVHGRMPILDGPVVERSPNA